MMFFAGLLHVQWIRPAVLGMLGLWRSAPTPSIWVGCRLLVFVAAVYGSAVAPLGLLGCGCGMGLTSEVGSRQRTVWCFSRWSASLTSATGVCELRVRL